MTVRPTRRQVLAGTAATAACLAVPSASAAPARSALPSPADSGIEHIVFL